MTSEKRKRLEWILDALSLGAVLQYAAYRFLQSTMFVFYYSNTYKKITMLLLIVFGGVRWLYLATKKWKERDEQGRKRFLLYCLGAVILALPFFYVGWKHDYKFLIFLPICCMCLYDMRAEKILKAFVWTIGTLLAATVLCCLSGTVRNLVQTQGNKVVAAYGIINTTDFASYFTFLLLTAWCGMKKKGWTSCIFFAAFVAITSYLVYMLTDSRTSIDIGVIFVVLILWDCLVDHNNTRSRGIRRIDRAINCLSLVAFPLIGLVVIILVYSYAQQAAWAVHVDEVLTGRLRVTLDPYNTFGISPFGNRLANMHGRGGTLLSIGWSSGYGYLDIAYAMLAIRYGWVITAVIMSLWVWITARALKQGDRRMALAMTIMAIHAFSEARIIDINYNIFLAMPFCMIKSSSETRRQEKIAWIPTIIGAVLVGGVFFLLPHILPWLRTVFSSNGWNSGTAAFESLTICTGIAICIWLFWYLLNRMIQTHNKRALVCLVIMIVICATSAIAMNNEINWQLVAQAARLEEEESVVRLVSSVAMQPVYVAEQEELFKRRYGGVVDHLFSTDEMRAGSIFTDSNVEALGVISSGGMYTSVSDKTGLYSYDPIVIKTLSSEGYNWTPYYSGRRTVNLSDVALFNEKEITGDNLLLIGPCRITTTNEENDQFGGTYEVEFKLSGVESSTDDVIGYLEVLGESNEIVIKKEELLLSDFDDSGIASRKIVYSVGETPKVSYAISVLAGVKVRIDEIAWRCISQSAVSTGVEIQPDGKILMKSQTDGNCFNMIHFQLYDENWEYILSFGEKSTPGIVSGDYVHNLPGGLYYLRLKGNTNQADRWLRIRIYIEEGDVIHYSYNLEELASDHIIVKDVRINDKRIEAFWY